MSETTITTAATEYANRPPDERYPSLGALVDVARQDKDLSRERTYSLRDLRAVAVTPYRSFHTGGQPQTIQLQSPKGCANLTHWSFGQLCRMVGAPASYLRDLPAELGAECINHGLSGVEVGGDAVLLARAPNGRPEPSIRAMTSEKYGRVWDADLYSAIDRTFDADVWSLPPTWSGEAAGAYRGDRDSFLILTNGGSIVNDPSARNLGGPAPVGVADGGAMYRGIMVRNSEVGAASVTIETILYRYICGNHMLWGATRASSFKRRHVGASVQRDTIREIARIARNWADQPARADEAIIRLLIDREIGHTRDAVIGELAKLGATKTQAAAAYTACEQHEGASPRSYWGAAQGLTRVSQDSGYQDARLQLDRLAGQLLARGAKLVAA